MIGNGDTIKVWFEPWLRDPTNFKLSSMPCLGLENIHVKDLFIPRKLEWDYEPLGEFFNKRDIKEIMSIPLLMRRGPDSIIWLHSTYRVYFVKIGYAVAMMLTQCEDLQPVCGDWKNIWRLNVLPKIKHFIWRCCRDCIPTRYRLFQKCITVPCTCLFCRTNLENSWHLFITYSYAQSCWRDVGLIDDVELLASNAESFVDWLLSMLFSVLLLLLATQMVHIALEYSCDWSNARMYSYGHGSSTCTNQFPVH